jgi:predicted nucleotidyltransferase
MTDDVHGDEMLKRVVATVVRVARPTRVVLFGSLARGDAGPNSDMDLLVVVPPGRHRRETARQVYRALARLGRAVDVVVVTTEDIELYRHDPGMVIAAALAEGRELYAA